MASGGMIRKPEANVAPNTGSGAIQDVYREKMKRSVVYIDTHEYVEYIHVAYSYGTYSH